MRRRVGSEWWMGFELCGIKIKYIEGGYTLCVYLLALA